jgi:hypothetical protein
MMPPCVFRFDGSSWAEGIKLLASDAAEQDCFGASVPISADALLIPGRICRVRPI